MSAAVNPIRNDSLSNSFNLKIGLALYDALDVAGWLVIIGSLVAAIAAVIVRFVSRIKNGV
jgi:hypothetical protein